LKIQQPTLPFDNGFFTSEGIDKMIRKKKITLNLENTRPCIKNENAVFQNQEAITFQMTMYDAINKIIEKDGYDNQYLDSTYGYYTYLKDYDCVLAHYNWHPIRGGGVKTPYENIKIVEEKLNRRLERLFEQIELADEINIYWGCTKHRFLQLDKKVFSLSKSVVRKNLLSTFSLWKEKKVIFHEI
jgi:hypothetical protein